MSNPEQEQTIATISALAHALRSKKLSNIQLDQLQIAEHLLTNISVQTQLETPPVAEAGIWGDTEPKKYVPRFEPSEPVRVHIPADMVQHAHWERATITGIQPRDTVEGGCVYQTSKTGKQWVTPNRLEKLSK